jgi:hypothetical protein
VRGLRHWRDAACALYDAGNEKRPDEVRMTTPLCRRAVLAAPLAAIVLPHERRTAIPGSP